MKNTNGRLLVKALVLLLAACGPSQDQPAGQAAGVEAEARVVAERGAPAVPRLDWTPCGGDMEGLECATALVPLDYDRPRGEKIALALARLRATDQAQRIGSLFFNPGGPGASGIDYLAYAGPVTGGPQVGRLLYDLTGGRFDLVAFDPRGVARSTPLECFESLDEEYAWSASMPWWFPYRPEQERPFFEAWRYGAGRCLGAGEPIVAHMSTADAARDLDLLRRAVGDDRLTYVGFSYGTYLGETYASLFPDKVRALVLDGVVDPVTWSAGLSRIANTPATEREWAEFTRLCDEAYAVDPARCRLGGRAGAAANVQVLLDYLYAAPEPVDGWLGPDVVIVNAIGGALYDPTQWAAY
ncbi:MAG: alpha/beta hydrolase, partial [Anaeromyxobacteraceae bacterium]|nr:alpha/beta hydrolase [Anaeromyxobacteraceae bacterium]